MVLSMWGMDRKGASRIRASILRLSSLGCIDPLSLGFEEVEGDLVVVVLNLAVKACTARSDKGTYEARGKMVVLVVLRGVCGDNRYSRSLMEG